jgi:hypothetical protein
MPTAGALAQQVHMSRPAISQIRKTSDDRPAQWQGRMESGEAIYIRYRNGFLTVGFGPDLDAAVNAASSPDGYAWDKPDADGLDGWMEWAEAEPHVVRAWNAYIERRDRTDT